MRNPALPKLLRAIADSTMAVEDHIRHDVIFNAAADELERLDASEQVLNGIGEAMESHGYVHMTNGRDIGLLLDKLERFESEKEADNDR